MSASDHLSAAQHASSPLARDQIMHRGMYLPSTNAVAAEATPDSVYRNLIKVQSNDGEVHPRVGVHWTDSMPEAESFARQGRAAFVLHATNPGQEGAMSHDMRERTGVMNVDTPMDDSEREIPLHPGHPVHVHGLTVLQRNLGPGVNQERRHYTVDWKLRA